MSKHHTTHTPQWLNTSQLAAELQLSQSTLYKWSSRGYPDFPRCTRLPNGSIVVASTDLDAWLEERMS